MSAIKQLVTVKRERFSYAVPSAWYTETLGQFVTQDHADDYCTRMNKENDGWYYYFNVRYAQQTEKGFHYYVPRYLVAHGYDYILGFDQKQDAIEFARKRNAHNDTNYCYEVVRRITHYCL